MEGNLKSAETDIVCSACAARSSVPDSPCHIDGIRLPQIKVGERHQAVVDDFEGPIFGCDVGSTPVVGRGESSEDLTFQELAEPIWDPSLIHPLDLDFFFTALS